MTPRASLVSLAVLAFAASPALAFDCAKAKSQVELAICAAPDLKRLDDGLEQAYAGLKARLAATEQKMLARSQKRWIARREYCSAGDEEANACIARLTAERTRLLGGTPESGPGYPKPLVPSFMVQDGSPQSWDIDIAVLRFPDAVTPGEKALNKEADAVLGAVKPGPHGEETGASIYAREDRFALAYASPGLISVRHDFYVNEGGAHGNYGAVNYNIDMETGRLLQARDLFGAPAAAIMTLWCKGQIEAEKRQRLEGLEVEEDVAARDAAISQHVSDLARWSIGREEIVIHFDPYAVGAYAEGSYQCRLPTAGVKALARPGVLLP